MAEKMLIDASHEEETRVVVIRGNRIEEFDFESQHKKQLRGNIYLAKVTRVEPSLQAAFVDYGGNRHGFLAFSEIHPDYYQIPLADRQALIQAEAEAEQADADDDNDDGKADADEEPSQKKTSSKPKSRRSRSRKKTPPEATESEPATAASASAAAEDSPSAPGVEKTPSGDTGESGAEDGNSDADSADGDGADARKSSPDEMLAEVETDSVSETVESAKDDNNDVELSARDVVEGSSRRRGAKSKRKDRDSDDHENGDENGDGNRVESVGAEDALEELPDRSQRKPRKQYRIQEVIKRRQILLVQVVKEERGNKGAALTTYLSLAGRYSVLMPNTARGGGISRKITSVPDRKRLKEIARGLEVPQGMGVILRTAGANRTKAEIKRDFEYLMRLWENVRNLTLGSTAPTLVYEEGSLIKRSIRDLYNREISEIVVSGEDGYREAKSFMKMLMPSHAKVVQPYRDIHPIYARSGIEAQLDRMLQPQVNLKSGGYIIINQTEALVAIDVNSGRSTREHSIEDTALQTNLEAADEVARQLRLRDLAGLIVIDFIDMEEKRNNRAVEKKVKECLKHDRARIQVGRISHFGLLEMSRQRIRASVLESTTQVCEACGGTGHVRSKSSVALHCIRGIEEYLLKNTTHNIAVRAVPEIALYLLNQKRDTITELEKRFGLEIVIEADAGVGSQHFVVDRGEPVDEPVKIDEIVHYESSFIDENEGTPDHSGLEEVETGQDTRDDSSGGNKRKRRRRRRGGRSDDTGESNHDADDGGDSDNTQDRAENRDDDADEQRQHKRRRRGKRGGRRKRSGDETDVTSADTAESGDSGENPDAEPDTAGTIPDSADEPDGDAPTGAVEKKPARRSRRKSVPEQAKSDEPETTAPAGDAGGHAAGRASEEQKSESEKAPVEAGAGDDVSQDDEKKRSDSDRLASEPVLTSSTAKPEEETKKPRKGGWWQRRGFF